MPMFILDDATGIGSNDLDSLQAFIDLVIIANDDGIGLDNPAGGMQRVTYTQTQTGAPQDRLNALVNTTFTPDYGSGPQNVDVVVIPALSGFTLDDGTSFQNNGTALPPSNSGLAGASLNPTANCLVIYDTQQNICVARDGTGGNIDLSISNPVVLYHEFSHAFRIVNNGMLQLTFECNPSSPEERAAIIDENDMRTQIANRQGVTPELRDPGIHCGKVGCSGGCCIIASVVSRSPESPQVRFLRSVRDHFVRGTEAGHAFFEHFFRDYYSFSPQVCTIMAGDPDIPLHAAEGFVHPLLDFWKLMIERASRGLREDADIGAAFVRDHQDRSLAEVRLRAMQATADYWGGAVTGAIPAQLASLLRERAWPSEYVQWALIAPVAAYHGLLKLLLAGESAERIGAEFNRFLDSWTPRFPISGIWAALPAKQVGSELAFCENNLMLSDTSRRRFRRRLKEAFEDITSIARVLASETEMEVANA